MSKKPVTIAKPKPKKVQAMIDAAKATPKLTAKKANAKTGGATKRVAKPVSEPTRKAIIEASEKASAKLKAEAAKAVKATPEPAKPARKGKKFDPTTKEWDKVPAAPAEPVINPADFGAGDEDDMKTTVLPKSKLAPGAKTAVVTVKPETPRLMRRTYLRDGKVGGGTVLASGAVQATLTFTREQFDKLFGHAQSKGISLSEAARECVVALLGI